MLCQHCVGQAGESVVVAGDDEVGTEWIPCNQCGGTGVMETSERYIFLGEDAPTFVEHIPPSERKVRAFARTSYGVVVQDRGW